MIAARSFVRRTSTKSPTNKQQTTNKDNAAALDAAQVADIVTAEQRDNQSTYAFKLLAAQQAEGASPSSSSFTAYDLEYVVQVCRGAIVEGLRGARRCAAPANDADLQVISRHYVTRVLVPSDGGGGVAYLVKASATSERWPEVAADLLAAVRSFSPSGGGGDDGGAS